MSEPKTNFFDMDRITVPLTYLFTSPPTEIRFFCKIALSNDDAASRQAFYSKSNDEQAKGQHAYNVDFLARITAKAPEGLPGFEDYVRNAIVKQMDEPGSDAAAARDKVNTDPASIVIGNISDDRIREFLKEYLGEDIEMKRKVAADAIQLYNRYTQPPEFFR